MYRASCCARLGRAFRHLSRTLVTTISFRTRICSILRPSPSDTNPIPPILPTGIIDGCSPYSELLCRSIPRDTDRHRYVYSREIVFVSFLRACVRSCVRLRGDASQTVLLNLYNSELILAALCWSCRADPLCRGVAGPPVPFVPPFLLVPILRGHPCSIPLFQTQCFIPLVS